ncbi:hypothetical protein GKO32_20090 [Amycolatopsis sp. RM579]|uniref:Uncharacterized protein n=1 Tax=Amycolatopsis pithecellobii TaxID=664692 RepID=A0A6N7Z4F7_9PSEU|nr:hypothetical protein [Amycolatopsis pithecellobii]
MPTATTPSATTPSTEDPNAVAEAAKKEGSEGINPYTGKPMEVDPETGEPYPIDPKTGEPVKDAGDEPETLKVQQGDKTIEMSEPDKDGKMDIKVDDGAGQPKDYKLDWGDGKGPAGQHFGPQGAPGQPGPDGAYTPGADGKIHIEDGNLKITAERPEGPDGPTVVTVDDGTGKPTTYTLGDAKDNAAANLAGNADGATPKPGGVPADPAIAVSGDVAAPGAPTPEGAAGPGGAPGADGAQPGGSAAPGAGAHTAEGAGGAALGDGATAGAGTPASGAGLGDGVAAVPPGAPATESAAPGSPGGDGPLAATTPANNTDGLSAVGAGVTEGAVSGSLGDTASLGTGAQTGAGLHQPANAALGAQPLGVPEPAGAHGQNAGGLTGMGGMLGGLGAAGGGGEDQERSSRQYRIDGGIFNSAGSGGRISGSLDDEGDRSVTQR